MWLDEWLFNEGETVTNFAKKLKITRVHLGAIISGKRRAGVDLAKRISDMTDGKITTDEILYCDRKERNKPLKARRKRKTN